MSLSFKRRLCPRTIRISFLPGLLFVFIVGTSVPARATHMMGGDITWKCVGQDSFMVTLVVYRDCNGIQLPTIQILASCNTSGAVLKTVSSPVPAPIDITPTCSSSCTRCQSSSCSFPYGIEKYTFTELFILDNAGSCCEIRFSHPMCCRNSTITTGAANENFYLESVMNRCLTPCDNSPYFNSVPIHILCVGFDNRLSFTANDDDHDTSTGGLLDSLSYEWTPPLRGHAQNTSWLSPYSYDKPVYFWGFPDDTLPFPRGLQLNATLGELSFRPMMIEQTVMAVKVNEYRKISGVWTKIGEITRDLQLIMISCPNNQPPLTSGPYYKEVVAGNTVSFTINTNDYDPNDTLYIDWNAAIPAANWTTNNYQVKHPTANLTWTPTQADASSQPYSFVVTVKDNACPISGSSSRTYQVLVKYNTGIADKNDDIEVTVSPNPLSDRIIVRSAKETIKRVTVYNLSGELIAEQKGTNALLSEIDARIFPPGYYLLNIELTSGIQCRRQVVLQ